MQARLSFLILFFSALLLSASPALSKGGSEPSDEGVSPRCEAAIDNAAGRYSKCLLKASAKDAKRGNEDRLLARQMRCEDKFNAQVARAQDRFGEERCTPYLSEIAERTATYAQGAATEARGTASPSFLFVQNGTGGTLSDTTLTLTDVSSQTGWFTDRPYRGSGQMNTEDFVALWDEGETFADDPPNADFTCTVDSEVVNYVVELTSPSMAGEDLSYSGAAVGDTVLPETQITCDADSHLFIDSWGTMSCPGQPWCPPDFSAYLCNGCNGCAVAEPGPCPPDSGYGVNCGTWFPGCEGGDCNRCMDGNCCPANSVCHFPGGPPGPSNPVSYSTCVCADGSTPTYNEIAAHTACGDSPLDSQSSGTSEPLD